MNSGKLIGVVVALALIAFGVVWLVSGDDADTENAQATESQTEAAETNSETPSTDTANEPEQETVNGIPPLTAAEVATHNTEDDCWTIINGDVYDVTSYVPRHPGGLVEILQACGNDATELFTGVDPAGRNHSPTAEGILTDFELGPLES